MKLSVETVHDKGQGDVNEDQLLVQNNLFAVFDGATSLDGYTNKQGETGAKIAASIAKRVFSQNEGSLLELAEQANEKIRQAMQREEIDYKDEEKTWATTASVVRIGEDRAEYFQIADSFILLIYNDKSYELPAEPNNHDLTTLRKWKRLADRGETEIRDKLDSQIRETRRRANQDYGFLNGDLRAGQFFRTGQFDLKGIDSILLGTDGLQLPQRDPEQGENWAALVKIYLNRGLQGIKQRVRNLESSDPNCTKYIRTKTHDDLTGIAIRRERD